MIPTNPQGQIIIIPTRLLKELSTELAPILTCYLSSFSKPMLCTKGVENC